MKGHVKGRLVAGQKVRVVLDAEVARMNQGWYLSWHVGSIDLDDDSLVSIEFIDEQEGACLSPHPSKALVCLSPKGHEGPHSVLHADGLEEWPS
jgi:hypothetical protein